MEIRVLKDESEYQVALHEAERLVALDPESGTKEADRLELLTLLIEDYEKRVFPMEVPDPIDAIEFRMNEQGLRQKDLVPLIGSRSRASEVLARKRPLTVHMIRALSVGLGIPVETLVGKPAPSKSALVVEPKTLDWNKFPVQAMQKRGWFESIKNKTSVSVEEMVKAFLSQISPSAAMRFRRRFRGEEIDERSYYSTLAWTARVLIRAKSEVKSHVTFDPAKITPEFLRDLAQLSWFAEGPRLAVEFLAKHGILVVVEPRLPNALIDGAAMLAENGTPIVGLTLRYDRIDYFWFTLLHEVVHIWKHLNTPDEAFVDRLENMGTADVVEKEANRIARDALIPRGVWKRSSAFLSPSKQSIQELADELHIHPGIVVGRLQFETGHFESFRELLGQGSVRKSFSAVAFV
jgi:HTH-type transcriptional regulator/antitoxin HigA